MKNEGRDKAGHEAKGSRNSWFTISIEPKRRYSGAEGLLRMMFHDLGARKLSDERRARCYRGAKR
jgi:hypothetical protein